MVSLPELHLRRCARKRCFRNPRKADEAARRASIKSGELIISYQCYDCRQWHIGHADPSQILARTSPGYPVCEVCLQRIPADRLESSRRKGTRVTTCSRYCQRALAARTTAQPDPALIPPVTKGPEKPPS
jgi:hypothetical protein